MRCKMQLTNQYAWNRRQSEGDWGCLFGSQPNLLRVDTSSLPPIVVNGHNIPVSDRCKNLGVMLSSNSFWNHQVFLVTSKVKYVLLNLRHDTFDLPFVVRKQLVVSTVMPHLVYVSVALLGISNRLESKLSRLQNMAIRFIYHLWRVTPTSTYRRRLGWLTTKKRRV